MEKQSIVRINETKEDDTRTVDKAIFERTWDTRDEGPSMENRAVYP